MGLTLELLLTFDEERSKFDEMQRRCLIVGGYRNDVIAYGRLHIISGGCGHKYWSLFVDGLNGWNGIRGLTTAKALYRMIKATVRVLNCIDLVIFSSANSFLKRSFN